MIKVFSSTSTQEQNLVRDKEKFINYIKKQNAFKLGEYMFENSLIDTTSEINEIDDTLKITSSMYVCTSKDIELLKEIKQLAFYGDERIYKKVNEILQK